MNKPHPIELATVANKRERNIKFFSVLDLASSDHLFYVVQSEKGNNEITVGNNIMTTTCSYIIIGEDAIYFDPRKESFTNKVDGRRKKKFKYADYPHLNDLLDVMLPAMHNTIFGT